MSDIADEKRLFFGIEIDAPWPEKFPFGKQLDESNRHITLAFLGKTDFSKLKEILPSLPLPAIKVGLVGKFDKCLFFPKKHPRVVAWHAEFLEKHSEFMAYQKQLATYLQEKGFYPDCRHEFTPHLTLARPPFDKNEWKNSFEPLPFVFKGIHLYESLGHSQYASLWHWSVLSPIEPLEHTADIAFWIRGASFDQLFLHAAIALSFSFPQMLAFFPLKSVFNSLDEVIGALNEMIFHADKEIGCPYKAVSFHMHLVETEKILNWEMIVDV